MNAGQTTGGNRENSLKIQFLGSGDNFGSGGRLHSCIYVADPGTPFLLDCGATVLIGMRRFEVNPLDVDVVLLSHLHGDHFAGIPFLVLEAQLISRRTKPLLIAGPPGTEQRILETMEVLYPRSSRAERRFDVRFRELPPGEESRIGTLRVTPRLVVHGSGAPPFALRIECGGKVIAYSGDTEWTDSLLDVAQGADLFICESYFYDKTMKNHLSYRTLKDHAAELGCRRLVITHMGEDMLRRVENLGEEYAEDGKVFFI
jgi:ribonuclease BN (tRNA processing enzyme)